MPGNASYKPGDVVPETGIYRVSHDSHRLMHEATLLQDMQFPRCKKCRHSVRFTLLRALQDRSVIPFRSSVILEEYESQEPLPLAG
jgi:hypothetical protein